MTKQICKKELSIKRTSKMKIFQLGITMIIVAATIFTACGDKNKNCDYEEGEYTNSYNSEILQKAEFERLANMCIQAVKDLTEQYPKYADIFQKYINEQPKGMVGLITAYYLALPECFQIVVDEEERELIRPISQSSYWALEYNKEYEKIHARTIDFKAAWDLCKRGKK